MLALKILTYQMYAAVLSASQALKSLLLYNFTTKKRFLRVNFAPMRTVLRSSHTHSMLRAQQNLTEQNFPTQ